MIELVRLQEKHAIELFCALQVVMGDRLLQAMPVHKSDILTRRNDINTLAYEMIQFGVKNPFIREEMYLHICRQVTRNPSIARRAKGWSILLVYLHCFVPKPSFIPFLFNFTLQAQSNLDKKTINATSITNMPHLVMVERYFLCLLDIYLLLFTRILSITFK
jgi:hypothetical protein